MEGHSKAAQVAKASKKCRVCKKSKKLENFPLDKKRPDGHHEWCKQCQTEASKARKAIIESFLMDQPEGTELMSLNAYAKMTGYNAGKVKRMCKNGEIAAINIGMGDQEHWRIAIPPKPSQFEIEEDNAIKVGDPSWLEATGLEEAAETHNDLNERMSSEMYQEGLILIGMLEMLPADLRLDLTPRAQRWIKKVIEDHG